MKTADPQLVTFFGSTKQGLQFDLWSITLQSGTVVRWTDADFDVRTADGRVFGRGPVVSRDQVSWVRGIEVDQLRFRMSGPTVMVDDQPLPAFAAAGGFDGAWVQLERAYFDFAAVFKGSLTWFAGQAADVTPGRMGAEVIVKSQLTQLSQQLPRNLYQAGCLNDLYDSSCGVSRSAFTYVGSVTAILGAGTNPVLQTTVNSLPYGFLSLGVLKFTDGANVGLSRTVQLQGDSGMVQFSRPFPFPVQVGDAFSVYAGCDKSQPTCSGKFNNLGKFRGAPYIPAPETVT